MRQLTVYLILLMGELIQLLDLRLSVTRHWLLHPKYCANRLEKLLIPFLQALVQIKSACGNSLPSATRYSPA